MSWLNGGKILRRGFGLSTDELNHVALGAVSLAMSLTSATIFYVLAWTNEDYRIAYIIATCLMCFLSMNNITSIRRRLRFYRFNKEDERRRLRVVVGEIEEEKCRGEA